ncbi:MAG: MarR family transcriptional regulator [Synergistaceae bacterium]|jgi:DNA-binding MarR family transcriptional regulator|nr:MarR family transcriptional regulator [Synergistaceae bacterium]
MDEIKTTVTRQLRHLQMLMHRAMFQDFSGSGPFHSPHRGQGRILALLKMKPEISQKELTYLLDMSKQSLAELLAKLEKNEYITREPSEEDKRVMMVKLTENGAKAADDVTENEPAATEFLDCLDEEELRRFSEYLERIIKGYEEKFPNEDFEERRRLLLEFMSHHHHPHDFDSHDRHHRSFAGRLRELFAGGRGEGDPREPERNFGNGDDLRWQRARFEARGLGRE